MDILLGFLHLDFIDSASAASSRIRHMHFQGRCHHSGRCSKCKAAESRMLGELRFGDAIISMPMAEHSCNHIAPIPFGTGGFTSRNISNSLGRRGLLAAPKLEVRIEVGCDTYPPRRRWCQFARRSVVLPRRSCRDDVVQSDSIRMRSFNLCPKMPAPLAPSLLPSSHVKSHHFSTSTPAYTRPTRHRPFRGRHSPCIFLPHFLTWA